MLMFKSLYIWKTINKDGRPQVKPNIPGARDESTSKGWRILSDEAAMEEYERGATEQVSTKESEQFFWVLKCLIINKPIQIQISHFFLQVFWV